MWWMDASFSRGRTRSGSVSGSTTAARQLTIDPTLAYSTYFGGVGNEDAYGIRADAQGECVRSRLLRSRRAGCAEAVLLLSAFL